MQSFFGKLLTDSYYRKSLLMKKKHQMEHQLGAYTDCNHEQGLAVIHPAYYRHIVKDAPEKFTRFAKMIFDADTSEAGVEPFITACRFSDSA